VEALDGIVKDDATFATNTSSLSVADQAAATNRPQQFIGLHFFNPPQVMPLLEVVKAEGTADAAYDLGFEVGTELGKTNVAAGDNRGFIVNRCSCRTCSTRSAPTSRGSARSRTSTRG